MESSRRSAARADPAGATPPTAPAAARVAPVAGAPGARATHADRPRFLVAFSGGLDSTVLLHAAARALGPEALVAVHVHHGLQPAADDWPAHCEAQARALGVAFDCRRVAGAPPRGASLEAWARDARYAALGDAAAAHDARAVLLAHHADDQVETVLMRLARGTGLDGLAGMAPVSSRGALALVRPFLGLPRAAIAAYAARHGLRWIEDPTNADLRRRRNAIRHQVLPALDADDPAFRARLLAALATVRAANAAVAARAAEDLRSARAGSGEALDRSALAAWPAARRHAVLRAWLREHGLRPPTRARLAEIDRQLVAARGAHGRVLHDGRLLVRDRDEVRVRDPGALARRAPGPVQLRWAGEPAIDLPEWGGRLSFTLAPSDAPGAISALWLRSQPLTLTAGGASSLRLRPHPRARRRTLKNLYQERGVPAWTRPSLPLVHVAGRLLYAAGIGMDRSDDWPGEGARVALRWESPAAAPGVDLESIAGGEPAR